MFDPKVLEMIAVGAGETLYMTVLSTLAAYLLGVPMGVMLVVGEKGGILPMPKTVKCLGFAVNLIRSVPFIILLVLLIPFTRAVTGTTFGPTAASVSLIVAAAPFVARLVEASVREVDQGVIEASLSMGASPMQVIFKVLLPEAMPSLLAGATTAAVTILGYSAMAGTVGGGGLGDIAIRYGYNRYQTDIMLVTVVVLILIVVLIQTIGTRITAKCDHRL